MGTPCGFVLQFSDGCTIYHTGDTCVHSDMALIGEIYRPNVAILPIGDFFTMGPFQAAHALRLIGAPIAIPEHFATFPLLHGSPEQLRVELDKLNVSTEVVSLRPGESWTYAGR
jgi:L-ascorbate metabolism protein UlaG (beta-lactamase superfamily)